jgi:glycosyltransferase involved in cell wall biosynthesis
MRILYIVPYAPSLIRVRPYQLINSLARRGHIVDVATLWSSSEEEKGLQDMALQNTNITIRARRLPAWRPVWNCLRALPSRMPLQAAFCFEPGMLHEVDRALKEYPYDVIHVEHLRGSLFGLNARRLLLQDRVNHGSPGAHPPIVWDCVDCISHLFNQASKQSLSFNGRWMTKLELPRTRPFEGWLTTQFDHTLVTSSVDREALRQLADQQQERTKPDDFRPGGESDISVIPNGVDLNYFNPYTGMRDPATLIFSGKMSYHANVTAALHLIQDIMPRVWRQRPDVKLLIAGKNPPRSIHTLAESANSVSGDKPSVTVTGSVPDMRPLRLCYTAPAFKTKYWKQWPAPLR